MTNERNETRCLGNMGLTCLAECKASNEAQTATIRLFADLGKDAPGILYSSSKYGGSLFWVSLHQTLAQQWPIGLKKCKRFGKEGLK